MHPRGPGSCFVEGGEGGEGGGEVGFFKRIPHVFLKGFS